MTDGSKEIWQEILLTCDSEETIQFSLSTPMKIGESKIGILIIGERVINLDSYINSIIEFEELIKLGHIRMLRECNQEELSVNEFSRYLYRLKPIKELEKVRNSTLLIHFKRICFFGGLIIVIGGILLIIFGGSVSGRSFYTAIGSNGGNFNKVNSISGFGITLIGTILVGVSLLTRKVR